MDIRAKYILRYYFFKFVPNFFYKYILMLKYKRFTKRNLNMKNPKRLSEKIQWMKLYTKNSQKTLLSDKFKVKEFVLKKIPKLKFAKIYQKGTSFEDINFSLLPDKFVLKTNHAWHTNFIVKNKNNINDEVMKILAKEYKSLLKINYAYWSYYELHYKDIVPYIFAEELLGEPENITHYELWCFNGKVEFLSFRYQKRSWDNSHFYNVQYFFNSKWEPVDFYIDYKSNEEFQLSENKEKLIYYAELLAEGIDFVRVDFMEINNELYFSEMTFTPCSGFFKFVPDYYDIYYGQKLRIKKMDSKKA